MIGTIIKNIIGIICWLLVIAILVSVFIFFILPIFSEDRQQIFEQEMEAHNQTLNLVKENFAYVLEADNVKADVNGENVNLVISGEACNLKVTLTKQLKVISLTTEDKTEDDTVFPVFSSIGMAAILGISIYLIYKCFKNITEEVEVRRRIKRQKTATEINVLV